MTNAEDFDLESGFYNLTIWYNDASSDYYAGKVKVIKAERVDKRPDAPVILGEEEFVGKTTVSIAATEGLNVYYTLDGTDPTRQSTVYTEPFAITETTTVKAVTAYLDATLTSSPRPSRRSATSRPRLLHSSSRASRLSRM